MKRTRTPQQRARLLGAPLAALVVLAGGCSTSSNDDDGGDSSCARELRFEGRTYSDVRPPGAVDFTRGRELGKARGVPCVPDESTSAGGDAWTPRVFEVKGLDSTLAIAVGDTPSALEFFAVHEGGTDQLPVEVERFLTTH